MVSNMSELDNWLRLEGGFFREWEIKKMRRLEKGSDYIIIYQKLMLLSINSEGFLRFTGIEENIFEQLSIEIDESEELIKETIDFCIKNLLVTERSTVVGDVYFLTKVPELLTCDGYCNLGD